MGPKAGLNVLLGLALLILCTGCEAPRDNPLDPGSENYSPPVDPNWSAQITSFQIKTEHIFPPPEPERWLVIAEADVVDQDGIDRVYLEIADTLKYVMPFDASIGRYRYVFYPSQTGFLIHSYIGAPFYLYVYDQEGNVHKSDRSMISRILDDIPQMTRPAAGSVVFTRTPVLVWEKYFTDYEITYTVRVRTSAGAVWFEKSGIVREEVSDNPEDPQYDSLLVDIPLDEVQYLWNVWVYDRLENFSRSETLLFSVIDTTSQDLP